ncbi:MAG: glycogen/starch synthase [bacterium]
MKVSSIDTQARLNFATNNLAKSQKIDDSQTPKPTSIETSTPPIAKTVPVNFTSIHRMNKPSAVITFGGTKNKDQVLFVAAEHYDQVGGVATVVKDFETFSPKEKEMIWTPYYNGEVKYDPKTGKETGEAAVLKKPDGTPIYTKMDLTKNYLEDVLKDKKNYVELEKVSEKMMQFAEDDIEIALYRVKGTNHGMVFTNSTARMGKPYAQMAGSHGGEGLYAYASVGAALPKTWKGDPYAQFSKAVTELLPELEKQGFAPETVICNDAQTAFIPEFMAQRSKSGDAYYQAMKPTYVTHNLGNGSYTGPTNYQNLATSFMTKEQIAAVKKDPAFIEAIVEGETEKYFAKLMPEIEAASLGNSPNATLIPLLHRKNDYVKAMTTVSENYAEQIATNPKKSPQSVYTLWSKLYKEGKVGGILNPCNNPAFTIHGPLNGQPGYSKAQQALNTNTATEETIPAFEILKKDATYEEMKAVKNNNKKNLFHRLNGTFHTKDIGNIIGGASDKTTKIIGSIDKKWIDKIDNGENVKLFVSWGRADFQKGFDIVLDSFEKLTEKIGTENSVLVFGGPLGKDADSEKIREKVKTMLKDDKFKGRLVLIDGFAPNAPLSSAADSAVFASRFEPCGLTDLEALRFYCTPVVTNTEGLSQKNPDPRIASEKDIATSYKTTNEFYMHDEILKTKTPKLTEVYEKLVAYEKAALQYKKVDASVIDTLAAENVKNSTIYKYLEKTYIDDILSDELAEAMAANINQTDETSKLIYENHKKLDTTWEGNAKLHPHPSNKSSRQLYQEIHIDPTPTKAEKTLFNFDNSIMNKIKDSTEETSKKIGKEIGEGSKNFWKQHGGKVGIAAGAVVVIGGLASYFAKPKNASINADGDAFQRTSPNKNNKVQNKPTNASNKHNQAQKQQTAKRA